MLSVLLFIITLLSGFLVSFNFLAEKFNQLEQVRELVGKSKLYVGITSVIIGIWSLLKGYIIADLIPASLAIASGLILAGVVFNYINLSDDPEKSNMKKVTIQENLDKYSLPIGITTMVFSVLHFIDVVSVGETYFI